MQAGTAPASQAVPGAHWESPLTALPRSAQLLTASGHLHAHPSRVTMPDAGALAALLPHSDFNHDLADKQRCMRRSMQPAAQLLDHGHGQLGMAASVATCSPALHNVAGHTMGLDADLENAMQWLNAEIGPVEDAAEKVRVFWAGLCERRQGLVCLLFEAGMCRNCALQRAAALILGDGSAAGSQLMVRRQLLTLESHVIFDRLQMLLAFSLDVASVLQASHVDDFATTGGVHAVIHRFTSPILPCQYGP